MYKILLFSLLFVFQISLFSDWTKALGTLQNSDSLKKSYLSGMLLGESYGIYEVKNLKSKQNVKDLYEINENSLYWFDDSKELNSNISNMIEAIHMSQSEGLDSSRYHIDEIEFIFKKISNGVIFDDRDQNLALIKLDILLSDAFFTLARDLSLGQINYKDFRNILYKKSKDENINHRWEAKVAEHDYVQLLQKAKEGGDFSEVIYSLVNDNAIYNSLKDAYIRYKSIQDQDGFQKISNGKNLKIGNVSNRVKELRIRLYQSGDLDFVDEDNKKFDKELRDGLKRFQKRVGIWPSGILNSTTQKALNVSVQKRLAKIKLNLERSRWESDDFDFRYILVNIPEFMMHFKEGNELLMNARVIVGKLKNPTPIFKADMSYIVLNPRWSVPNSIVSKEMLGKIQDDPYYLEDRNFKTYDRWTRKGRKEIDSFDVDWFQYDKNSKIPYNIVKEPGSSNPLGNVKFMFPNDHAVYIHDTPKKNLFKKSVRAFSHGCIRLHKPQKLLEFVSQGYLDSSYLDIKSKLNTGNNISLGLNEKIPVYVRYYTAYIDERGAVVFTKDVYGYDKIQEKLLLEK